MSQGHENQNQVRERAYELWEQAGQPEGRHDEFWHRATAELGSLSADTAEPMSDPVAPAASSPSQGKLPTGTTTDI